MLFYAPAFLLKINKVQKHFSHVTIHATQQIHVPQFLPGQRWIRERNLHPRYKDKDIPLNLLQAESVYEAF